MSQMKSAIVSLFVLGVLAVPTKPEMHSLHYYKRANQEVPFYYPKSNTQWSQLSPKNIAPVPDDEALKIGLQKLSSELGITESELKVERWFRGSASNVMHIYTQRIINNVPVDNQKAAVYVKNGQAISWSSSFDAKETSPQFTSQFTGETVISLQEAEDIATKEFGLPRDDMEAKKVYIQIPSGKLVEAYQFQLHDLAKGEWIQVSVDSTTGQIVQVIDFTNHATFKAIAFPKNDPNEGFDNIVNPENKDASPAGWNSDGQRQFAGTEGNNVRSLIRGAPVNGDANGNFDVDFDPKQQPDVPQNQKTAAVNNFYVSNMMHDIFYQYGFDEKSGNFQANNFGKGGQGGDAVRINNQAPGVNNANFGTPPDGQAPVMNMFQWTLTSPRRDGSLDNSIPIHEYGHGITNRLTGGPQAANCLSALESGALGEGWGDAFAMFLLRKASDTRDTDFGVGKFAVNGANGIRSFPYSTNLKTNPLTFNDVNRRIPQPHAAGEVWATSLNEMYWNLVDRFGFSENFLDASQKKGNIMALQLVVSALKIQPCNPTFLEARDAILQADRNIYNGELKCDIIKAFAKRGMGTDAQSNGRTFQAGNAVPEECNNSNPPAPTNQGEQRSTPQAPTSNGADIVFSKDRAFMTAEVKVGQSVTLQYDTARMGGACKNFVICADTVNTRETCIEQQLDSDGVQDFKFTFTTAGPNNLYFKSSDETGCDKQDKVGLFGYTLQVL